MTNQIEPCYCITCGDTYDPRRWHLGYQTCLDCGAEAAIATRTTWCIAPIAHKQGATLVTKKSDLKGLNKYTA